MKDKPSWAVCDLVIVNVETKFNRQVGRLFHQPIEASLLQLLECQFHLDVPSMALKHSPE